MTKILESWGRFNLYRDDVFLRSFPTYEKAQEERNRIELEAYWAGSISAKGARADITKEDHK